ncbi:hypothetical protein, partial [Bradyrhizobium yuanmingense]
TPAFLAALQVSTAHAPSPTVEKMLLGMMDTARKSNQAADLQHGWTSFCISAVARGGFARH